MSTEWKDSGICPYFLSRFHIIVEGCLLKTVTTFTLIFFLIRKQKFRRKFKEWYVIDSTHLMDIDTVTQEVETALSLTELAEFNP